MNRFNFVGQNRIITELDAIVEHANQNANFFGTYLFIGPPGVGKTRLAKTFCELISGIHYFYHHPDENNGNINLRNSSYHRVILIDEIHRAKNQEALYKFIDMHLYIIVLCTTNSQDVTDALISRSTRFVLDPYTDNEICQIILNAGKIFGVEYSQESAMMIAERCRQNPRQAVNTVQRMSILFQQKRFPITLSGIENAMDSIGIYNEGYTIDDINYINALENVGGRASLNTIIRMTGLDMGTIVETVEPFLMRKNILKIDARGRHLES